MAKVGTIGAATPVAMGQPGVPAQPEEEKTVSYMRKEFRSTAEARKRPPLLAEAMVDTHVDIPGVIGKGMLLTLTTDADVDVGENIGAKLQIDQARAEEWWAMAVALEQQMQARVVAVAEVEGI
jgi:membrane-bound ClpP family serine protease